MTSEKIKPVKELIPIIEKLKEEDKKIVTTNGVFDILHIGHIRYLQEAKKQGDILVMAINTDASVKENKGPKRPLNNQSDRAEALAALECVDYVTFFEEKDPKNILEHIKPDIHVKGGDYDMSQIIEKETVEKNGGKVILISEIKGYATTSLINKILDVYKE